MTFSDPFKYTGMSALSHDRGIPIAVLKKAKVRKAPGFNLNNSINYKVLEPWLKEHMSELVSPTDTHDVDNFTLEDLKKQKLSRDIELSDLEIQKRKREYLPPEEVRGFLTGMAVAQSAVLKKMIKELPAKCAGKSIGEIEQELETAVIEVFNVFKESLDKFMPKA